jgi:uncharacterized membrane protein YgaE (UPF0421/DUF939 family)
MDLLFILIGVGLAIFVILVSYRSISRGIKAKSRLKENQSSEDEEILEKLKSKNLSSKDLKKMYDDLQKKKKDDL